MFIHWLFLLQLTSVLSDGYQRSDFDRFYVPIAERPVDVVVDVINDLGVRILQQYDRHGNVAFSPTGTGFVLSALYEGSIGDGSKQIAHVLNLPRDRDILRIGFRDIHRRLRSYLNADGFLGGLTLSNENIRLRPQYEDILRFYGFDLGATQSGINDTSAIPETMTTQSTGNNDSSKDTTIISQMLDTTTITGMPIIEEITSSGTTVDTVSIDSITQQAGPIEETLSTDNPITSTATVVEVFDGTMGIVTTSERLVEGTTKKMTDSPSPLTSMGVDSSMTLSSVSTAPAMTDRANDSSLLITTTLPTTDSQSSTVPVITSTSETPTTIDLTTISIGSMLEERTTTSATLTTTVDRVPSSSPSSGSTTTVNSLSNGETIAPTDSSIVSTTTAPNPTTTFSLTTLMSVVMSNIPLENIEETSMELSSQSVGTESSIEQTTQTISLTETKTNDSVTGETIPLTTVVTDSVVPENEAIETTSTIDPVMRSSTEKINDILTTGVAIDSSTVLSDPIVDETSTLTNKDEVNDSTDEPNTTSMENTTGGSTNGNVKRSSRSPRSFSGYFDSVPDGGAWMREVGSWKIYPASTNEATVQDSMRISFLVKGCHISAVSATSYVAVLPFAFFPSLRAVAIEFPLDDPRYNILLLMPTERTDTHRLADDLAAKSLRLLRKYLQPTWVRATIPSFNLRGFVTLTPFLQRLGIRDVFEPRLADLSLMTSDVGVYARDVQQSIGVNIRNYMTADRTHSRESSTTQLPLIVPSRWDSYRFAHAGNGLFERAGPVPFTAQHPFLYFIIDAETSATLIAGRVDDPLNSRIL